MSYIKGLIYALSLYTRIPVPASKLERKDGEKAIVFLPAAGIITGLLVYGFSLVCGERELPVFLKISVYSLIPLIVTGGFHVDGFMDVADARSSYKSTEEKLDILKDPHIGAFAVIKLILLGLCWLGAVSVVAGSEDKEPVLLYAISFFTVRAACGIVSVFLKRAKKDGMLHSETKSVSGIDKTLLVLQLLLGAALMMIVDVIAGALSVAVIVVFSVYYRWLCYREFGGVTGDTAGYYITVGEMLILVTIAVFKLI